MKSGYDNVADKALKVVLSGGGTGGHLFPALTVAEEFLRRNRQTMILFIGTEKGLEASLVPRKGFRLSTITVSGIRGKGLLRSFRSLLEIPGSLLQSLRILREFYPDIVIGVGGYASGPAVLSACIMGIPTAIAEQNTIPSVTNRVLGFFADRIFLSFKETGKWFSSKRFLVTGNPVRSSFRQTVDRERSREDIFTVLVFGGSQGAAAINRTVREALPWLKEIKDKVRFIHQTGERDRAETEAAYLESGVRAEVLPFIDDMVKAYQAADILVCRAGATTIAEITVSGKASILVPFPYATGNHQVLNAQVLVKAGAAEMVLEKDLIGELLARKIKELIYNPEKIAVMESAARRFGNPNAAECIVESCINLVEEKSQK